MRAVWFVLLIFSWAGSVVADASGPLPDFIVIAKDDSEIHSLAITGEPRWILVHIQPDCSQCSRLLAFLDRRPADDLKRVVLIIESDREKTTRFLARYGNLSQAPYFLDRDGSAASALSVKGTPVTFGVRAGVIEWSMSGTPENAWNAMLSTWIHPEETPIQ